jgi:hypothetical protein
MRVGPCGALTVTREEISAQDRSAGRKRGVEARRGSTGGSADLFTLREVEGQACEKHHEEKGLQPQAVAFGFVLGL